jgi:hypothetical protein
MSTLSRNKSLRQDISDRWQWIALVLLLLCGFGAIVLVPALLRVDSLRTVPYNLHSVLSADYSQDRLQLRHAQLDMAVIAQVVRDRQPTPAGDNPGLIPGLDTPAPTATPPASALPPNPLSTIQPSQTPLANTPENTQKVTSTDQPQDTPNPGRTSEPTQTPQAGVIYPTATRSSDRTPTRTQPPASATPQASKTPSYTISSPTASLIPETTTHPSATILASTPTRTSVPSQEPTFTMLPPTHTVAPTPTPRPNTPTPEPTEPPPTNTPRPRPTRTREPYPPPPYP